MTAPAAAPNVAVVGGGLAGLSAALALGTAGCRVELLEAKRQLGGRAASFRDPASGELVDHCQHVGMGCCTNLIDFCRRTGQADCFRRYRTLHFIAPDGRRYDFRPSRWLPAPLHLAGAFWNLKFLRVSERLAIARAMWKLMRCGPIDRGNEATIGHWLQQQGQSPRAIEWFWNVILVSTLGEQLDRASLSAARKVMLDGFLSARDAAAVDVPCVPLSALYGPRLESSLAAHDVRLRRGTLVRCVEQRRGALVVRSEEGESAFDFVVLAVPWSKVGSIVSEPIAAGWPALADFRCISSSPITGVHLWFDRAITQLPHAVLVGRLSQWIFYHPSERQQATDQEHYYQVVISGSRDLAGSDRQQIVEQVRSELAAVWPEAGRARLLRSRIVTEQEAVFSAQPGLDLVRPAQRTPIERLFVAGDWTATGWPATMESAVRSGYLAAEAVLEQTGRAMRFVVDDLRRGLLAQLLIKGH